ncbi:hypothetical protein ABFV59_05385 [Pseudomonas silesiensis]|uniref:hypothetical protein n=1 Tax=Pseudomonas fluorescens TaxID=294 RepID=UPI001CD19FE6|nr:hypothetical protein [Pseudomonas fluorescens]
MKVIRGQAALRKYQFGRQVAEHFFYGICGIYTHHRRSTNPNEFGFNIGCMEGVNPYDLGNVPVAMVESGRNLSASFVSGNLLLYSTYKMRWKPDPAVARFWGVR